MVFMRKHLFFLIPVFLLTFAGCKITSDQHFNSSVSFFEETVIDSVRNYVVDKDVTISVANVNGSIAIKGHEHNNVMLTITKQGNNNEFSKIRPIVTATQTAITVETESEPHNNVAVNYELLVPETAHLELIKNVNGSINIEKVTGPITAKTVNGSILIKPLADTATITSVNGSIECWIPETINASLKVKVAIGSIENDFDLLKTTTVTGESIKGMIGSSEQAAIKLKTTTGLIRIKKI
jgi:DUF4097 and DUF4098 domain-containing protein YvlB